MVNQTSILFDRDQILLSYFDELLWKQAMDYQVIRVSATGRPIYTSENEHALDALMLTILGFTIEFPNITKILKEHQVARKSSVKFPNFNHLKQKVLPHADDVYREEKHSKTREAKDNPNWHIEHVPLGYYKGKQNPNSFTRGRLNSGFRRSKF